MPRQPTVESLTKRLKQAEKNGMRFMEQRNKFADDLRHLGRVRDALSEEATKLRIENMELRKEVESAHAQIAKCKDELHTKHERINSLLNENLDQMGEIEELRATVVTLAKKLAS